MLLTPWFVACGLFLVTGTTAWLIPHSAERPLYPHWRRGNSIFHRSGCLSLKQCITKLRTFNYIRKGNLVGDGLSMEVILSLLPNEVMKFGEIESLKQFYSATNGVKYEDGQNELQNLWIFPNYFLLTLQEAVQLYENFPRKELNIINQERESTIGNALDISNAGILNDFQSSWFPLLSSGMGAYIFLNLSDGHIFEYSPFEDLHHHRNKLIQHKDILDFIQSIVENLENGKYGIDINGVVVDLMEQSPIDVVHRIDEINFRKLNKDDVGEDSTDPIRVKRDRLKNLIESIQAKTDEHLRNLFNKFGIPLLHLSCMNMETVCDYIITVIGKQKSLQDLCKVTDRMVVKSQSKHICGQTKRNKGYDCIVYPFVTTIPANKNGDVREPILVPNYQSSILGSQLKAFYEAALRDVGHRHMRNHCFKLVNPKVWLDV